MASAKKRISILFIAIFLCTCFSFVIVPREVKAVYATPALTGNMKTDLIAVANSQRGCTDGAGYGGGSWCAYFVSWSARRANIPTSIIPNSGAVASYTNCGTKHYVNKVNNEYVPQPGDLAIFTRNGSTYSHIGIVTSYGGYATNVGHWCNITDGNWGGRVSDHTSKHTDCRDPSGEHWVGLYVTPNYTSLPESNLKSCLDYIEGGDGYIYFRGWAFVKDKPQVNVDIHVYIGEERAIIIKSNALRTDLNSSFPGIGDNHGFNAKIETDKIGWQNVKLIVVDPTDTATQYELFNSNLGIGNPLVSKIQYVSGGNGSVSIKGWALDITRDQNIADIHVYLDNERIGIINANKANSDVSKEYPDINGNHGFDEVISTTKTGWHDLKLIVVDPTFKFPQYEFYNGRIGIGEKENTENIKPAPTATPTAVPTPTPKPTSSLNRPSSAQEAIIKGDLMRKGKATIGSFALLGQYLLKTKTLDEYQLKAADMNGDGKVSIADFTLLGKKLLGV